MNSTLFQYAELFAELSDAGGADWVNELNVRCDSQSVVHKHGDFDRWFDAWHRLPAASGCHVDGSRDRVTVNGAGVTPDKTALTEMPMEFHPWRKGPFGVFGVDIDTEWRSDWKWRRVNGQVEFRNRRVLDVGCGNGYFGWRMLDAGASCVVGLDPFPLYVMQHEAIKRYAPDAPNYVLPVGDDCLKERMGLFDVAVSMGVLYHRTSPIDHLKSLFETLRSGGELVLETLIIDDRNENVLVPEGRYAKMRNVWFLPTVSMLQRWLRRSGFRHIQVVDVTATTTDEQRSTDWMTFESLSDFLDPDDATLTAEGYPAPLRAMVTASK